MAEQSEATTSETFGKMLSTNPVVVRQIMAGLRNKGYVQSEKGHGGGWTLACNLSKLTLRDIYATTGGSSLLAIGNKTEIHGCLVEQTVNAALEKIGQDTEEFLLSRLGGVTLADLNADLRKRLAVRDGCTKQKKKSYGN